MALSYDSYETTLTLNTDPLGWNVTIPAGTDCVLLMASGYTESGLDPLVSVNLGGSTPFTIATNHHRADTYADVGIAYLFSPSTGAQTINIDYSTTDYEIRFYAVYIIDCATDGFRDTDEATGYSLTLTTESGDLVVATAHLGGGGGCTWTNATERHDADTVHGTTATFATLSADGTSETISCSDNYSAITAVVFKPAAAGGESVTLTMTSCVQKNTTTGLLVPIEAYMSTASGIQKNVTTSFPLSAEITAAVSSGIQKNIAGTFEIPIEITTDPANCVQRNVADTPSILAELICEAISGIQKNITEVPNIAVEITLDTASGVQKNVAGVITLVVEGAGEEVTLTVYSGVQRNFVDTFTIPIEASVTTASGIQRNASNTPDAILESILTVINSVQKNVGDVISDLPTEIKVTVSDGVQKNVSDVVSLPVELSLTLADGVQRNIGGAVSLDIEALLTIVDGIQKNVAGTLTLSVSAAGDVLARILRVISKSQQRTYTIKTQRTIKTKGTRSIELIVD